MASQNGATGGGYDSDKSLFENTRLKAAEAKPLGYQDTMAELTRAQWEDYKTRYLPVQENLLALAGNNELLNQQMDRNNYNINNSFNLAEQNESMRLGRYGLTPENSAQNNTNNSLLKNLTTASVNNETRQSVDDLQNKIRTGSGGTPQSLADIGGK